jgi:hypothetical protein
MRTNRLFSVKDKISYAKRKPEFTTTRNLAKTAVSGSLFISPSLIVGYYLYLF